MRRTAPSWFVGGGLDDCEGTLATTNCVLKELTALDSVLARSYGFDLKGLNE